MSIHPARGARGTRRLVLGALLTLSAILGFGCRSTCDGSLSAPCDPIEEIRKAARLGITNTAPCSGPMSAGHIEANITGFVTDAPAKRSVTAHAATHEFATLTNGRCSECIRLGLSSTVTISNVITCTAMACPPAYYDAAGMFHPEEDCNHCNDRTARCSNGHAVAIQGSAIGFSGRLLGKGTP